MVILGALACFTDGRRLGGKHVNTCIHKYLITTSVFTTALRFLAAINAVKLAIHRKRRGVAKEKYPAVGLLVSADHTQAGLHVSPNRNRRS